MEVVPLPRPLECVHEIPDVQAGMHGPNIDRAAAMSRA